ncbi:MULTISPECIES: NAD-dependent epimerase/dehydratase family protein [Paenibacillus]|uniref:NAD-dependent epimerase/dehydratase family protein n=1 Tax=Paenibacillus TaxID=44249 RepID=UPI002DB7D884|nr:NAD(P)-dependent oxidoreductase [Paenibacillus odorifer]MEC0133033.1 NAD(P)-dependent oxidoreductase [Paenibacillus odorifer]MEC0223468.1 NAD(P)-dependent oxidoreductase [Paenibacillus odorifer]
MKTTVIGAKGFIGRHVMHRLGQLGIEAYAPSREDLSLFNDHLGHVIYCAGVTSDFRQRPFDTIRAHISFLAELLERATFESFLYLSSTRVYVNQNTDEMGEEEGQLLVNPFQAEDLFNLSKITGESLCLMDSRPNVRVARVSNVCGNDFSSNNFIYAIIKDAVNNGKIVLQTTLDSEKDYITVSDVAELLIQISHSGKERMYNVASGTNTTNKQWVEGISHHTGCEVELISNAKTVIFPAVNICRVQAEFNFVPQNCLDILENLIQQYVNGKERF